jgi:membrane protein required for colicin V production
MTASTWIDWGFVAVLAASVLVGGVRGLVYEVLALMGWLVAWLVARAWGVDLAQMLHLGSPGSALQHGAGYVLAFVGALLAWRLLSWAVRQLLHASPLAPVDRLLGAAFGLLRGLVMLLVLVGLVDLTPLGHMAAWSASVGVGQVRMLLNVIGPVLPGDSGKPPRA